MADVGEETPACLVDIGKPRIGTPQFRGAFVDFVLKSPLAFKQSCVAFRKLCSHAIEAFHGAAELVAALYLQPGAEVARSDGGGPRSYRCDASQQRMGDCSIDQKADHQGCQKGRQRKLAQFVLEIRSRNLRCLRREAFLVDHVAERRAKACGKEVEAGGEAHLRFRGSARHQNLLSLAVEDIEARAHGRRDPRSPARQLAPQIIRAASLFGQSRGKAIEG